MPPITSSKTDYPSFVVKILQGWVASNMPLKVHEFNNWEIGIDIYTLYTNMYKTDNK